MRDLGFFLSLVLLWVCGICVGLTFPRADTNYKVVIAQPTDQQLIEFWFGGNQDQAQLRNRICK